MLLVLFRPTFSLLRFNTAQRLKKHISTEVNEHTQSRSRHFMLYWHILSPSYFNLSALPSQLVFTSYFRLAPVKSSDLIEATKEL